MQSTKGNTMSTFITFYVYVSIAGFLALRFYGKGMFSRTGARMWMVPNIVFGGSFAAFVLCAVHDFYFGETNIAGTPVLQWGWLCFISGTWWRCLNRRLADIDHPTIGRLRYVKQLDRYWGQVDRPEKAIKFVLALAGCSDIQGILQSSERFVKQLTQVDNSATSFIESQIPNSAETSQDHPTLTSVELYEGGAATLFYHRGSKPVAITMEPDG